MLSHSLGTESSIRSRENRRIRNGKVQTEKFQRAEFVQLIKYSLAGACVGVCWNYGKCRASKDGTQDIGNDESFFEQKERGQWWRWPVVKSSSSWIRNEKPQTAGNPANLKHSQDAGYPCKHTYTCQHTDRPTLTHQHTQASVMRRTRCQGPHPKNFFLATRISDELWALMDGWMGFGCRRLPMICRNSFSFLGVCTGRKFGFKSQKNLTWYSGFLKFETECLKSQHRI